jgi:predicted nucleic acid-binding protein
VLSAENSINTENIVEKISGYVKSIGDISIFSPSNIVNEEKKEVLKNLLKSDIPEELIAEQLDLDLTTVRELIQEISTDNLKERK